VKDLPLATKRTHPRVSNPAHIQDSPMSKRPCSRMTFLARVLA
jgi:hypothetical protein